MDPSSRLRFGTDLLSKAYLVQPPKSQDVPIVIDTGASLSLTPFKEDFISPIEPVDGEMTGIKSAIAIKGQGLVEWHVADHKGQDVIIRATAYWVPEADIRLFSTQSYFQEHEGGRLIQETNRIVVDLPNSQGDISLEFPYHPVSNLPLMLLDQSENDVVGLTCRQRANLGSTASDAYGILSDQNLNLSPAQKELLLWHNRLGHAGFAWIQSLMRPRKGVEGDPSEPAFIPTKYPQTAKLRQEEYPNCAACLMAKAHRKSPGDKRSISVPHREQALKREHLVPGECVSADQFTTTTPGRRLVPRFVGCCTEVQQSLDGIARQPPTHDQRSPNNQRSSSSRSAGLLTVSMTAARSSWR